MDTHKYFARFNEQIWSGLVTCPIGAALLVSGYSGLVGEWRATERHDKIAAVIVAMGCLQVDNNLEYNIRCRNAGICLGSSG